MNYYNEIDDKAAAWLRELVSRKLIPAGDVDTRSITEIKAHELKGYTQCHFFAGVAGWSLALQLAGWPEDRPVWTGSCPCQPFSTAGKGLAQADERHLWPAFFNLIRECRPEHVFGEQVASAIGHGWLDGISADLEAEGYACGAAVLGAHSVGAPHIRQRLYWVAHSHNARPQRRISEELREYPNQCISGEGGSPDGLGNARCPSDERRGEFGNVGRSAGEEQGEARQRQWSRDADSDSVQDDCGLVLPDSDGCEPGRSSAAPAGHGDTAITAGFWSDFQLIQCRDGKTRRVPTEPILQRVANGIPLAVDHMRDIVVKLEAQVDYYAKKTKRTSTEVLREMQCAFWSEAIQWDAGGRIGLLSPEILLAALCQLERKLGNFECSKAQGFRQAQTGILLNVRNYAAKEATSCPSQGWGYAQQLARELADSLHELPHENALEAAQSIFDRSLGFPLARGVPSRVMLLRGYGNAIVPQCAQAFIEAYCDVQRDRVLGMTFNEQEFWG